MNLTVIASGSSGNCYLLENESEALIIECGVRLNKAKEALGFNIRKVVGVLVSHLHGDHAGHIGEYERVFPCFANNSVIEAKGLKRTTEIKAGNGIKTGQFKILPFEAVHDVPCLGFIINHPDMGNLFFLTDSVVCDYIFPNLNHILIECNYATDVLNTSVANGLHPSVARRVTGSHMELNTCKDVLKMQDLTNVYNILLLHLSSNNSDEDEFKDVLSRATGKPIQIAKAGLKIELNNKPY
jgi:phosphoribosyl 1,2-cyclic phosphodiesterase